MTVKIEACLILDAEELVGHGFKVEQDTAVGNSGWGARREIVVRRLSDGTFWKGWYDHDVAAGNLAAVPPGWVTFTQVYPHTRTVTEYHEKPADSVVQ